MCLNRRSWLAGLSGAAAALAARRVFAAAPGAATTVGATRPRFAANPFTLGVASGQPRPHSVVLWTRLAPQPFQPGGGLDPVPVEVRWQLAEDRLFSRGLREGTVLAQAALAHSVRVPVDGLESARAYHYRFMAGDAVSATGRTRTAPTEDAQPARLRLALASCQHYEQGHYAAHRELAGLDLDVLLFVGDYIYDSSNPRYLIRPHESSEKPCTLEAFRARHATYKLDADLQACHAAHPWIVTWDDHEVRNDYAAALGTGDLPAHEFVAVRAAAYQAYFEHLPLLPAQQPAGAAMRLHDRFTWGQLAELWTLDARQYRSGQACNEPGTSGGHLQWHCAELRQPQRSLLGLAQERWLGQGLATSTRAWKLVGQATQMSPCGIDTPAGRVVYSDGWDGYAPARQRLLQGIADAGLRDVVMLGGDVHRHVAANLRVQPNEPRSPVVASELVTSSISSRGVSDAAMALIRRSNPDILHARSDERGYMLCEFDKHSLHCIARATAFPVTARASLHTQAAFAIESGRAGPQPG